MGFCDCCCGSGPPKDEADLYLEQQHQQQSSSIATSPVAAVVTSQDEAEIELTATTAVPATTTKPSQPSSTVPALATNQNDTNENEIDMSGNPQEVDVGIENIGMNKDDYGTTLSAPSEAGAGSTIDIHWTGPNDSGDYVGICNGSSSSTAASPIQFAYTSSGNPCKLRLPTKVGQYEIKYFSGKVNHPIYATVPITIIPVSATVSVPQVEVNAGSTIDVIWTGPNYSGDYIGITKSGVDTSLQFAYTSSGTPAKVRLPTQPGMYEIKYFIGQGNSVLASTPITLIAVSATLNAPSTAGAGSTIDVVWTGPNHSGDYIGITKIGSNSSLQFSYTSSGTPTKVRLPATPGQYELKYFVGQDNSVLTSVPITLLAETATLTAPPEAGAGSTIDVVWTGPNNSGDYIGITKLGATSSLQFSYTSSGTPATLRLPATPGQYELKYFVGQDNSVLAASPITLRAETATLTAPSDAGAGATIEVAWSGPNNSGDYIGITKLGASSSLQFAYTSSGTPATICLPATPGQYELKYFVGQDNSVLAAIPITLRAETATLAATSEAGAGSTLSVAWTGPNNSGDYIGITALGENSSLQYAYTSNGTPVEILLPMKPGLYELKYYVGQDNSILATVPITIFANAATLTAPTEARAVSTIDVDWTGPNNSGDYIGLTKPGANSSLQYTYTSSGTPAKVFLPSKPGQYELKYFEGQDNSVLASFPITIIEASVTLSLPTEGVVGTSVEVMWTGPNNDADYIGITAVGGTDVLDYTHTSSGSPISLTLPTKPGAYELKYFVGYDNCVLARVPITVKKQ